MPSELRDFLAGLEHVSEEKVVWGTGRQPTPLRARSYLGRELPPLGSVTSVRGVVLLGDKVLVMRNADGMHVLPGGRREAGETLAETLTREVLEETGWEVEVGPSLGFLAFLHLGPKPPGFAHPYPEFTQLVYRTTARRHVPGAKLPDDYEVEAVFHPVSEAFSWRRRREGEGRAGLKPVPTREGRFTECPAGCGRPTGLSRISILRSRLRRSHRGRSR